MQILKNTFLKIIFLIQWNICHEKLCKIPSTNISTLPIYAKNRIILYNVTSISCILKDARRKSCLCHWQWSTQSIIKPNHKRNYRCYLALVNICESHKKVITMLYNIITASQILMRETKYFSFSLHVLVLGWWLFKDSLFTILHQSHDRVFSYTFTVNFNR